jgi:hypothetical protein
VERETIREAVERLRQRGEHVGLRAVQRLVGGSFRDVGALLKEVLPMDSERSIDHPEPLPSVEKYPALRDARTRLLTLEAAAGDLEVQVKEHSLTCEALAVELSVVEDSYLLGKVEEAAVSTVRESLATAEAHRLTAHAALDGHHLNLRRLRVLIEGLEVEAQKVVLAELRPLHDQAIRDMATAFDVLQEAANREEEIRLKGRVRTAFGWSNPLPFAAIVGYNGATGQVNATLGDLFFVWHADPYVKRILADAEGKP